MFLQFFICNTLGNCEIFGLRRVRRDQQEHDNRRSDWRRLHRFQRGKGPFGAHQRPLSRTERRRHTTDEIRENTARKYRFKQVFKTGREYKWYEKIFVKNNY